MVDVDGVATSWWEMITEVDKEVEGV